ncbi:hypothetical protein QJS66_03735 [Kocuria rhizophila]|nr:hypothetical protein QJS66_03735 [Kocuria rhizophila]
MIDTAWQAEQIVATGLADVVLMGREALRDPHVALTAARALGVQEFPVRARRRATAARPPASPGVVRTAT